MLAHRPAACRRTFVDQFRSHSVPVQIRCGAAAAVRCAGAAVVALAAVARGFTTALWAGIDVSGSAEPNEPFATAAARPAGSRRSFTEARPVVVGAEARGRLRFARIARLQVSPLLLVLSRCPALRRSPCFSLLSCTLETVAHHRTQSSSSAKVIFATFTPLIRSGTR